LIHVLSNNANLIKDIGDITKFYKTLIEEKIDPLSVDIKGRNALHFAVKSGNLHYVKFLVDVEKFDPN
jgi:ankyrin repeat protein